MRASFTLILILFTLASVSLQAQQPDKTLPGEGEEAPPDISTIDRDLLDDDDAVQAMLEQGEIAITLDDLELEVDFSDVDDWENYEEDVRYVVVDDGQYTAEVEDNQIIWGQNTDEFDDGVVAVVLAQDGGNDNNGYGIMCRANEANNIEGYHFWISGRGEAAIVLYQEDDGYNFLVDWVDSDAIDTRGANIMHAVCVEEYLALYVNGILVAEVQDDTFDDGVTGLSVRNYEDSGFARAIFDDLRIWTASD